MNVLHSEFTYVLQLLVPDVQSDPVAGYTPSHLDTHSADLALAASDPHTRVLCRGGVGDAEAGAGRHDGVFEKTDVVPWGDAVPAEVDDGVSDELAGAVEGEVATACGGVEFGEREGRVWVRV